GARAQRDHRVGPRGARGGPADRSGGLAGVNRHAGRKESRTNASFVLALDQGTTGSTALLLDRRGRVVARGYAELPQHFPKPGWVEHEAQEIWASVVKAASRARR